MVSVGVAGFWRSRHHNICERRHTYVLPVLLVGLVPVTTVATQNRCIPSLYFAVFLTANLLLLLIPTRVARVTRVAVCTTAEKTRCIRIIIIIRVPEDQYAFLLVSEYLNKPRRRNKNELSLSAINPRAVARFWPGPARVARRNGPDRTGP